MLTRNVGIVFCSKIEDGIYNYLITATNKDFTSSAIVGNAIVNVVREKVILKFFWKDLELTEDNLQFLRKEALEDAKDIEEQIYSDMIEG